MEIRYTKCKHELLLSNTRKTENTKFIKNPNSSVHCTVEYEYEYSRVGVERVRDSTQGLKKKLKFAKTKKILIKFLKNF